MRLCFSFTKFEVNVLAAIISLILCICVYFIFDYSPINLRMNLESKNASKVYFLGNVTNSAILKDVKIQQEWKLEIPKIDLVASIAEGTTEKILDAYIGHFEETQKENGNVGLAAHNRGYRVNYFNRLKELEIGDEIIYTCLGVSKTYEVIKSFIIEDTNWKVLENTADNRLTLITCVENQPTKRRCVQAIEKI